MKIWLDIIVEEKTFSIRALVDTGAEVNIIKRGNIPQEYLQKDRNPLVGANETKLKRGSHMHSRARNAGGKIIVGQQAVRVQCSIHMYYARNFGAGNPLIQMVGRPNFYGLSS